MTTTRKRIPPANAMTFRTPDGLEVMVEADTKGIPRRLTVEVDAKGTARLTRETLQYLVNGWEFLTASTATAGFIDPVPVTGGLAARAVATSGTTGERIVEAARIYSENIGQGPLMAVEREMHLSRSAASRLIRRAKDLGILES